MPGGRSAALQQTWATVPGQPGTDHLSLPKLLASPQPKQLQLVFSFPFLEMISLVMSPDPLFQRLHAAPAAAASSALLLLPQN